VAWVAHLEVEVDMAAAEQVAVTEERVAANRAEVIPSVWNLRKLDDRKGFGDHYYK
jgi:hypothetical protein